MAIEPPKIQSPEDVPRVLDWYAYNKVYLDITAGATNRQGQIADAFMAAFTEQFPGEPDPIGLVEAETTPHSLCLMVRARLLQACDMTKLRERMAALLND